MAKNRSPPEVRYDIIRSASIDDNIVNLAHFGMLQEHKDMLRKNRLFFLDEMNPEPVMQKVIASYPIGGHVHLHTFTALSASGRIILEKESKQRV